MSPKAVQLTAPSRLAFVDFKPRPLNGNEVRVQIAVAGICGSDLKNMLNPVMTPQIPGHEFSGTIMEVGSCYKDHFFVGDRVTAFPICGCLKCKACESGDFRDCADKRSLGFQLPGAFSEQVVIDGAFVIRLKGGITYEQGALLEPLCCGFRLMKEIERFALPGEKKRIVIIGDGPIALADLQALKSHSYENISVIGKYPNRLSIFQKLNVRVIPFSDGYLHALKRQGGIDICIMAAMAQGILKDILPLMNKGGVVYPQTRVSDAVILKQMSEKNISLGRAFAYFMDDFNQVMDLIVDKRINTDAMATDRIALSELADSFDRLFRKSDQMKLLVVNKNFRDPEPIPVVV